ncbi:MAG: outer membrane beta-barrel protein [Bacteroidales bacterium]
MKKHLFPFLLIVFTLCFCKQSFSQFNKIGGGIILATGSEYEYEGIQYFNKSFGLNVRANYDLSKRINLVPDFNIYLPYKETFVDGGESSTTVIAFNLNGHYILNPRTRNNLYFYFLAGIHVGGWNIKDDHRSGLLNITYNYNEFFVVPGANLGSGLQFKIGSKTEFFAEVKYTIAKTHQMIFTPGILYAF